MSNVQILSSARSNRISSTQRLGRVAVAFALVVLGSSACTRNKLHATFGTRHQAVMAAQANAHPARDPVVRGDEAKAAVQNYYNVIQGQNGPGGSGGGGPGPMSTAGVPPLR